MDDDVLLEQVAECCWVVSARQPLDGAELTRLRTKLRLRQQDVAALVGVSTTTVGQWERNERAIPATTSVRLRDLLREGRANGR